MKVKKTIFLTERNDPTIFQDFGRYHIFDKNIVMQQHVNEYSNETKIGDYIKNVIIKRELEIQLKNKKSDCLVYLLQGSDAEKIKINLENMIPRIKNNIIFSIVIDDYKPDSEEV